MPGRALQPLPLAPPRARRGGRLGLVAQCHARRRRGIHAHVIRLVIAELHHARSLPPPARRALLFGCSVYGCAHYEKTLKIYKCPTPTIYLQCRGRTLFRWVLLRILRSLRLLPDLVFIKIHLAECQGAGEGETVIRPTNDRNEIWN